MLIKRIIACRPILNFRFSSLRVVTSENPTETEKSMAKTLENLAKDVNDLKNNLRYQIQSAISSELSGKNHESNSNGKQSEKSLFWENLLSKYVPVATFILSSFSLFIFMRVNSMDEKIKKKEGKLADSIEEFRIELKEQIEKTEKNLEKNLKDLKIDLKEDIKVMEAKIEKSLEKIESKITDIEKSISSLDKNFVRLETSLNRLEFKIDNQGSSVNSIVLCILGIATANLCGMEVYKSFFK